eukprot:g889.t1
MGAGASTAKKSSIREKIKKACTDEEKIAIVNELQKMISHEDERHKSARKIQAVHRGKAARSVAKNGDDLQVVFAKFANFGKSHNQRGAGDSIDSTRFRKMLKESKIIHKKKFDNTACDMLHTSCKTKGAKVLTFTEFLEKALPKIAEAWGVDEGEIAFKIANGGPKNSGTKADYNKFYDDKSTWTGVATRGGPSTNDDRITLSKMMDRSDADVRGVGANKGR